MGEIIGSLVGVFVCFLGPLAALVGIIFVATKRGDVATERERLDRLEQQLTAQRTEIERLERRTRDLERGHEALVREGRRPAALVRVEGAVAAAPAAPVRVEVAEPSVERTDAPVPAARMEALAPARGPEPEETAAAAPEAARMVVASIAPNAAVTAAAQPAPSTATSPAVGSVVSPPVPGPPVEPRPPSAPEGGGDGEGGGLEQWVGVRGAAALGALVLVVAGLYFFRYSIEHGLIGPELRVALGALVGLGCVVASETVLRTRAPALAPWLAGAGIAILYGASWSLSALYHLAPLWVSGLLMVLTTAAATGLAIRRDALAIAILGLLGGFVTPIALSTGEDHPIPLFTYLLVLDAAILFVSHKKGWPSLGFLALVSTALYQIGWLAWRMEPGTLGIGAAVVVAFAGLFALVPARPASDDETPLPILTRAGAVLLPFCFVLTFAVRDGQLAHGWLTVGLTTLSTLAAALVARHFRMGWLVPVSALASLAILAVWLVAWPLDLEHAPHAVALILGPALVSWVSAERDRHERLDSLGAAGIATLGPIALLGIAMLVRGGQAWPLLLTVVALSALVARQSALVARPVFLVTAPLVLAFGFLAIDVAFARVDGSPSPSFLLALSVVPAVALSIGAVLGRAAARPGLDVAVTISACLALGALALRAEAPTTDAWPFAIAATACVALGLFATTRSAPAILSMVLVLAAAFAETVWAFVLPREGQPDLRLPTLAFAVLLFSAWPLFSRAASRSASTWRAAALAGPAFFLGLRRGWIGELGSGYIGLLPVLLAVVVLAIAFAARRRTRDDEATQRVATVWLAAVAASFVTLAIPLQLRNEWLTIGWSLEAVALLALDARLRHPGLRWLAVALFAAVLVRLCLNPYVLHYYVRGDWRIVNWLTYTYLVPAACLVAGAAILRPHEVAARHPMERSALGDAAERPIVAGVLFGGAVAVVFAWLNLTIFDWFASGPALTIPSDRLPARDLTISIVWAVYALVLLVLGMARESTALRVTSLLLVLVTCAKVFLYDLSNLEDLYRVAALVGLALSLIAVSIFYQRFVFRKGAAAPGGAS